MSGEQIAVTPGYWWATLVDPSRMPKGEDWISGQPEIVEVNDNNGEGDEAFSVQVFGVPVTQWPRNFVFHHRITATEQQAARIAQLEADLARVTAERDGLVDALRKADQPHWFYADGWEERCFFDPGEAVDFIDPETSCVIQVYCARPLASIWCAVSVKDDEDADQRFTFTEHSTEEEARAALASIKDREGQS